MLLCQYFNLLFFNPLYLKTSHYPSNPKWHVIMKFYEDFCFANIRTKQAGILWEQKFLYIPNYIKQITPTSDYD